MQKLTILGFLELRLGLKSFESSVSGNKKVSLKENFLKLEAEISRAATKGFLKKIQHQELFQDCLKG